jgi:hypothetical protein
MEEDDDTFERNTSEQGRHVRFERGIPRGVLPLFLPPICFAVMAFLCHSYTDSLFVIAYMGVDMVYYPPLCSLKLNITLSL